MAGERPQYPQKQINTVLSVANADFNSRFSKLKHIDKKDILTVLECCIPGRLFEDLENLTIAALYPELALDCKSTQLTLSLLADLTHTGPAAVASFSITPNSILDDPISAISSLGHDLWRWEYRYGSPVNDWAQWVNVEKLHDMQKEVIREAYDLLGQHFSDIWEVNQSIIARAKEAALLSGVNRIPCITDVAERVREVMQTQIAPTLRACKAQLDLLDDEKPGQGLDHVVIPIDPASGATTADMNPFQGQSIVRRQGKSWLEFKGWFTSAKREIVIWNQNLQSRANWLALVVLLVINPVVWILLAALPFTVLSTLLCGMPDSAPAIDSDFFAGLSSTVSGLAGLFAIISSLRRPDPYDAKRKKKKWKIESQFPRTFVVLLCVSVLSGISSVVVYPWESPWSIPLAFVSNVAQNVATLLIVQGSANRITELER